MLRSGMKRVWGFPNQAFQGSQSVTAPSAAWGKHGALSCFDGMERLQSDRGVLSGAGAWASFCITCPRLFAPRGFCCLALPKSPRSGAALCAGEGSRRWRCLVLNTSLKMQLLRCTKLRFANTQIPSKSTNRARPKPQPKPGEMRVVGELPAPSEDGHWHVPDSPGGSR